MNVKELVIKRTLFITTIVIIVLLNSISLADVVGIGSDIKYDAIVFVPMFVILSLVISIPVFVSMYKNHKNDNDFSKKTLVSKIVFIIMVIFLLFVLAYFAFIYKGGIGNRMEERKMYDKINSYMDREINKDEFEELINYVAFFNSSGHGFKNWIEFETSNPGLQMLIGGSGLDSVHLHSINGKEERYELDHIFKDDAIFELNIIEYNKNDKIQKIKVIEK